MKTSEGRILEELVTHLKPHREVQVALESTGHLWTRIYDRLEQEQIRVVLTNPKKTRALTENMIKTDPHRRRAEESL